MKNEVSTMAMAESDVQNQIVVYQPNETVRLDVRLENETVRLTQSQLCELFGVVKSNVSYHLKNIFTTNELDYGATVQKIRTVRLGMKGDVMEPELINMPNNRRGVKIERADLRCQNVASKADVKEAA